ncbi:MAG: theronine dehydrogenase [Archangium sp.]|nr:theronine dehydrogenase [Archangium sp.]
MGVETVDTWKLVSLSPLPAWALVLLSVALALGVLLAAWGVRHEPARRTRLALWGLRLLAGLAAVFFVLEPGVRRLQVARVKNRVAVLVDRSASMSFPVEPGGITRSAAVADALTRLGPSFEALSSRYAFEVSGFTPELMPVSPEALRAEPPVASRTDLLAVVRGLHASEASAARKLSGVLLLSDGADNAELAQGLTPRAKAALDDLGVPVSTVAVGGSALNDLAIDAVRVDDFAFVRSSVTAEVDLRGRGFAGQPVQVVLRREGQTVGTKSVTFTGDDEVQTVKFTFTPDQTGRFVYTVSMPVFPTEAVADNNVRSFSLKVIRDRVRVLLVAGRPSWDERFLRGMLRQDANVELISFYILRNSTDESGVSRNEERTELSLIPFPHEEIFREKIATFDLIIIVNFGNDDRGVSLSEYERDIRSYVENGGALAFLGGDHTFGESRAVRGPFDEVLPVEAAGPAELPAFTPRLTREGQRHPMTALATGNASSDEVWASLPPLPGMNVTRLRPGATALLEHPFRTVDGKNAPLLALWEFGRGRALALTTDASWRWAFTAHAKGAPTRSYERLWGNAMRWLVRDPELTAVGVSADPPSVEPGQPVALSVVARTPDYQPAAGAELEVELLSADDGHRVEQRRAVAGPDGTARLELLNVPAGAYKVTAKATREGKLLGDATESVAVRAVGPELADARVNAPLLKSLAEATSGRFFESPSAVSLDELPLVEPPLVEVGRSKDEPLWDRWYWLAAFVAVLGVEWGLRRRSGYV